MLPRRAVSTRIINHLQMKFDPFFLRKKLFKVSFGLFYIFSITQTPPFSEAMDVRVNRKRRLMKCLRHHNRSGLVPDTWQLLECLKVIWHLPMMFFEQ